MPRIAVIFGVVAFFSVVTGGWFAHPAGAIALAWLASTVFSPSRRRNLPVVASATGLLLVLVALGASWLVHPAAAMALGVFASVAFTRRRQNLPVVAGALAAMALFAVLGAGWVMFPLSALALAWLASTVFSGRLFDDRRTARAPAVSTSSRAALPAPGETTGNAWTSAATFSVPEREPVLAGGRRDRAARAKGKAQSTPSPAPAASPVAPPLGLPADIEAALAHHRDRLPPEAVTRLGELQAKGREAIASLEERGQSGSEHALLARSIVSDYAPSAVRAYLRLPPSTANEILLAEGKTGRDLLVDQLDLLHTGLSRVLTDTTRASGQEILAHQRFLEEKFRESKDFDV